MKDFISLYNPQSQRDFDRMMWNTYLRHYQNAFEKIAHINSDYKLKTKYTDLAEKENSKRFESKYKESQFHYLISNYGNRTREGKNNINGDVVAFGCSFTFGIGVPEEYTWISLLSQKLGINNYVNLGHPGSSISKIVRVFKNYIKFYRPKLCIFLLPHMGREELFIDGNDKYITDRITRKTTVDVVPNYAATGGEIAQSLQRKFYSIADDNFLTVNMYKNLDILKYAAYSSKTKIAVSTWCPDVSNHLKYFFTEKEILPKYIFLRKFEENLARDGMHPSKKVHEENVTKFVEHFQKYNILNG